MFRKSKFIALSNVLSYILVYLPTVLHFYTPVFGVIVCRYRIGPLSEFRPSVSLVLCPALKGYSRIAISPGKIQSSLLNMLASEISLNAEILVESLAQDFFGMLSEVLSQK